jgi:hypothetical protein
MGPGEGLNLIEGILKYDLRVFGSVWRSMDHRIKNKLVPINRNRFPIDAPDKFFVTEILIDLRRRYKT